MFSRKIVLALWLIFCVFLSSYAVAIACGGGGTERQEDLGRLLLKNNYTSITCAYLGTPYDYEGVKAHAGIDYPASSGKAIYAPIDGIPRLSSTSNEGNAVYFDLGDNKRLFIHHMKNLVTDRWVKQGDKIGEIHDDHVHAELRVNYTGTYLLGGLSCGGTCTASQVPEKTDDPSQIVDLSSASFSFTCKNVIDGFQKDSGDGGGQCVPYVRQETGIEWDCCHGSAKECYGQAKACGYDVGSYPEINSIVTFDDWDGNPYGHVGIVINMDESGKKILLRHSNWHLNEKVSEEWVNIDRLSIKGYIYCEGDNYGHGGMTEPDPSDPPVAGKLPDFITDKVTLANRSGKKEKYTWKINETAYVHSWTDNIGDADWEGKVKRIRVPFYLSSGTKEDSHSEWVRIGREKIQKSKLRRKDKPKHEYIRFELSKWANDSTVLPGRTYNVVVCADRPKDENNGDGDVKEKHKSNNCSTEAVFSIDYGPARNVDLITGNLALTHGRSELQAGEPYGLQVEISNIGTKRPWNGFRTVYDIKGPGTGGQWQGIADDGSNADQLYPGATQFEEISDGHGATAPMVGGDYTFRACADYEQVVPETDEGNNCTELEVYIVPPPLPDLVAHSLRLTNGRTSLTVGDLYGLEVGIQNIGEVTPDNGFRSSYAIKGPGTGDQWQQVADDGSDADELYPGATQWEYITDGHGAHIPDVPGTYTARACVDYQGNVAEEDEGNNCTKMTFEVKTEPACVILNPLEDLPTTGSFDLAATSIEFPDTINHGDEMHPQAELCGVSGSSPATRAIWAYANCDGTGFTAFDDDGDDGKDPGECITEENIKGDDVANMSPGWYVMYFIANGESKVPESDYSNNVQAKVFRVE